MADPNCRSHATAAWVQRFSGSGRRLEEAVELYQSLGFEVRLEPVDPKALPSEACTACFFVKMGSFYTLYTRPSPKLDTERPPCNKTPL